MKQGIGRVLLALGWIFLLLAAALTGFHQKSTDAGSYIALQRALDVYAEVGVDEETLDGAMRDLAERMRTGKALEAYPVTMFGRETNLFNEREIAHMDDVLALYTLLRLVIAVCAGLAAACMAIGWRMMRGRFFAGGLIAALMALTAAGAAAAWYVAKDFNAAFLAFHDLAFTNDLWLLDPSTDAMIRMFPEAFFEGIVGQCAGSAALWAALAAALALGIGTAARRVLSPKR